jgi:hypothetical protein
MNNPQNESSAINEVTSDSISSFYIPSQESATTSSMPSGINRAMPELPEPPLPAIGTGYPRTTAMYWIRQQTFNDRNQATDFSVTGEQGMMYYEYNNFTQITTPGIQLIVEDHDPWDPQAPYLSGLGVNEPVFIGFKIPARPIGVDKFWLFLWGPSYGIINFNIYPAMTGVAPFQPNVSAPIVWPALQDIIPNVPNNDGAWVSLETNESELILTPAMTFGQTYFLAVWRPLATTKFQPVLTYDNFNPDHDDESESYLDWTLTPAAYDFFCNVSILLHVFPTDINMRVNGLPVMNGAQPGSGWWENWLDPAINMTNRIRLYNVESDASELYFDVIWEGSFYSVQPGNATFQCWADRSYVEWNVTFYANFVPLAENKILIVHIEPNWNVTQVVVNGVSYSDWIVYNTSSKDWWVQINNASSGQWIVQSEAPNYVVDVEVFDEWGFPVSQAYVEDYLYIEGYVQSPTGVNQVDGTGYLLVYDPFDVLNYTAQDWIIPPPEGIVHFEWYPWWTINELGLYTLDVTWSNGTQAGMNSTTLLLVSTPSFIDVYSEIPAPGENVVKGTLIQLIIYYGEAYTGKEWPIIDATIKVINVTDPGGTEWVDWYLDFESQEQYPGYYFIYLTTDQAHLNFLHQVEIQLNHSLYDLQIYLKDFMIISSVSTILFREEWGLLNTSNIWTPNPEPYINTSMQEFTLLFADNASHLPISGAIIYAYLFTPEGGKNRRLVWEELSEGGATAGPRGRYNITIDVNPIAGDAFHAGDETNITIFAYHPAYEIAIATVFLHPQARPAYVDVPQEYQNLTLYVDWFYTNPLRVVLRDLFTHEDLTHGTLTAEIPEIGTKPLKLATPGLGLYEIENLTTAISPGNHIIVVHAYASDFQYSNATVQLTILPKQIIQHQVTLLTQIPPFPNQGTSVQFKVWFYFEDGPAPSGVSMQGGMPLPGETRVLLEIVPSMGTPETKTLYTNEDGSIEFDLELTYEGEYIFYVTIAGGEEYDELTHIQLMYEGDPIHVQVISMATMILGILPLALVLLFIILGGFLAYRQFIIMPKRYQRLAKYQAIADTFSDVANLNRLLVLHKESGICVFDPFAEENQDATLVAGFLQAISTFGHDLGDSHRLANNSEGARTLRELQYEGFRILINDGQFSRVALVLNGTPSEQLRGRLETFTEAFETRYKADFEHWEGRVDQFNSASDLVEEVFLISLRHPHGVATRKPKGVQLTSLESDIYKLSLELTKDRQYIFLGQILSTYLVAAKTDKLEALMAIYQLRTKDIFLPIHLAPVLPADNSAG